MIDGTKVQACPHPALLNSTNAAVFSSNASPNSRAGWSAKNGRWSNQIGSFN
ncbi:MAG: hypothetical protein LH609_15075 [Rudanella sp.]|nr:hypothetical protein [Rudanella sp.]